MRKALLIFMAFCMITIILSCMAESGMMHEISGTQSDIPFSVLNDQVYFLSQKEALFARKNTLYRYVICSSSINKDITIYAFSQDVAFYSVNSRIGLLGKNGILVNARYNSATPFYNDISIVKKNSNYGLLDISGQEIIPCQYQSIRYLENAFVFENEYESILVKYDGTVLVELTGLRIRDYNDDTIAFENLTTGLSGIIDMNGNCIIHAEWSTTSAFYGKWAMVVDIDGNYNLIDRDGNMFLSSFVDYCDPFFSNDVAIIADNDKAYLIDCHGSIISAGYKEIKTLNDDTVLLDNGTEKEFYNLKYKTYSNCPWDQVESYSEGFAAVRSGNKWGFIDESYNSIIPCQYRGVFDFSEGIAVVKEADTYYYIDTSGNRLFNRGFSMACSFENGLAAIMNENGEYGFIDYNGIVVIPFQWHSLNNLLYFHNGYCEIHDYKTDCTYYIDTEGNIIIKMNDQ